MSHSIAYLLVFHGSPDPRPQAAVNIVAEIFAQKVQYAGVAIGAVPKMAPTTADLSRSAEAAPVSALASPLVGTAYLECGPLSLHEQILQFWQSITRETNLERLLILPLFLLSGVHVMEDIPAEVALAQAALKQATTIEVRSHIGSHPGLHRLLTERMALLPVELWILLAHGSRRPHANQPVETLAARLGAVTAYWAVAPSLESQLQELMQLGLTKIAILPYFLFAGSITDAIADMVQRLSQQFPALELHLQNPIEASPEIADLLVDLADTTRIG